MVISRKNLEKIWRSDFYNLTFLVNVSTRSNA
jgi:hypothetical protein